MGLFDSLGSPAARQQLILRKALTLRVEQWPHGGSFYYRGGADLLLKHGRFYSGRELPEQYQPLAGEMNQCYENALRAAEQDPSLRYCEGVYTTGGGHYTSHAWCIDPDGELLELTYPTDPAKIANALDYHTHQPVLPPEFWAYWGAVFHPEYVRATEVAFPGKPVLDRPNWDELTDEVLGIEEDRTDWPVLHYPYDCDRRVL